MDTTNNTLRADVLVIGFSKGGKPVAATRGGLGRRVVLVDQSDRMYGGTCPKVGCVPTKALLDHSGKRQASDSADPHTRVPGPGAREQLSATASRSAHAELYRRHHRNLQRAVARAINAPRELIEDACQNAWTILLASEPNRPSSFAWLYVVATREAQRLCEVELSATACEPVSADAPCIDDVLEAREALGILASLPDRQRHDLTLRVAGFSYDEIAQLTGGRTVSTVRRSLDRAHAAIGRLRAALGQPARWAGSLSPPASTRTGPRR